MNLIFGLKIVGWLFTLVPLVAFILISISLIRGVGKDDPLILALTLAGFSVFLLGVITLVIVYMTNFF